eukprot:TRINITY_DN3935_c0_g1_i1.p1 TRINITY_DN3935_c0_g1~~TRINITY_DN3935_c0_g1_i1.p1  ORF type:complete len:130 (+),score=15.95 TRINITY_DN3935_c0_g1_i1:133-522(+)
MSKGQVMKDHCVQLLTRELSETKKKYARASKKAEVATTVLEKNRDQLKLQDELIESYKKEYIRLIKEKFRCGICGQWEDLMYRCPCKTMHYCSYVCQKYGWRKQSKQLSGPLYRMKEKMKVRIKVKQIY